MAVNKKNKESKAYDYLAYASIIIIILSISYIGFKFTGNAISTDTAEVNVTITSTTAINFTTDSLNFGAGSVNTGSPSATLQTDATAVDGSWEGTPGNLTLENIGNTNVSLEISMGKTAAEYIGGTSPSYEFKFSDNEAGSCVNATPTDVWTSTSTSNISLCSNFLVSDASDTINIGVKLVIPSDSLTGTLSDTFTATATGI